MNSGSPELAAGLAPVAADPAPLYDAIGRVFVVAGGDIEIAAALGIDPPCRWRHADEFEARVPMRRPGAPGAVR